MGEESNSIRCTWLHQFRIVREGISEKEFLCRVHDSGWTKRSNMPDAWREIQLTQGSKWTKGEADLIVRFCVLGVRIEGRGSAEEALRILALGDYAKWAISLMRMRHHL